MTFLLSFCLIQAESLKSQPELLTESEAFELVTKREKADFKELLKAEKAITEYSQEPSNPSDFHPEEQRFELLSFYVTNFDDLYSEITWRHENSVFSIWTNVSLVHLPALRRFEFDNVQYGYFGFADNIDSAVEEERAGPHYFNGQVYEYKSRWKDAPVEFGEEPEYVVIPEVAGTTVPDKLYEDMDAVLQFYLNNEESLRVTHLNALSMSRAHEEYLRQNPPQPEESVLIYSYTPSGE